MIQAYEKASAKTIGYELVGRRAGDIASCYADCSRAKDILGWSAVNDLNAMCQDSWRWQSLNPNGFID